MHLWIEICNTRLLSTLKPSDLLRMYLFPSAYRDVSVNCTFGIPWHHVIYKG